MIKEIKKRLNKSCKMLLIYLYLFACLTFTTLYVLNTLLKTGVFSRSQVDQSKKDDGSSSRTSSEQKSLSILSFSSLIKWIVRTSLFKWFFTKFISLAFWFSRLGKPKDSFTILSTGRAAKITYWRQGQEHSLYVPLRTCFMLEDRFLIGQKKSEGKEVNTLIGKVDDLICCFTPRQLGYDRILICDSERKVLGICHKNSIINPLQKLVTLKQNGSDIFNFEQMIGPVDCLENSSFSDHHLLMTFKDNELKSGQMFDNLDELYAPE